LSVDPAEAAWSAEQRLLLERHPRADWRSGESAIALFWLEVHDELRREAVALTVAGDDCRAGRLTPAQLAAVAGPRLRALLAHLHGHHEIEDHHYFPTLREAEPRFGADFDRLSADHTHLARNISATLAALAELVAAAGSAPDESADAWHAAVRYARASEELCRRLVRHLSDEEDLIIPLLIERGA
jgi:hypothetical protein